MGSASDVVRVWSSVASVVGVDSNWRTGSGWPTPFRTWATPVSAFRAGEHAEAARHLRARLEICRTFGFRRLQGMLLDKVGSVCLAEGRPGEADSSYLQALAMAAEMDETIAARRLASPVA